jgi:LPXTG-site transpeptidase (sortase) family protein
MAFMALGVVLLLIAGLAVAYPLWWTHRKDVGGSTLIHQFKSLPAQPAAKCVSSPETVKAQTAAGLVEIPALSLTAPVLQGLSDSVLAIAAGHDPDSPWPGGRGESIMESHDVSYFSQISKLKNGDHVIWVDHCSELTFKVIGKEVVTPGTLLEAPSNDRGLALVTCYPTDALFFVPDRFVLLTSLVTAAQAKTTPGQVKVVTPEVKVPAPPDLVAQGLTLQDSDVLVGVMKVTGSPSTDWSQGPASLDLEALALESYIGAEKAIGADNGTWWKDLAMPGLAMPSSAWSNGADTNVTEDIVGDSVESVTLSSPNITFVLGVRSGDLLIKSLSVP